MVVCGYHGITIVSGAAVEDAAAVLANDGAPGQAQPIQSLNVYATQNISGMLRLERRGLP
jgi:hypothetical protein